MTEIIAQARAVEDQCAALILKTVQSEGKDGFQENGENRVRILVQLQDLERRVTQVKDLKDPPAELQSTLKQVILEEYKIIRSTLEGVERMDQEMEKKMYQIITELRYLIEALKRSCG